MPKGKKIPNIRYPKSAVLLTLPQALAMPWALIQCVLIIHLKEAFPIFLFLHGPGAVFVGILQLDYSFALSHHFLHSPMSTAPQNKPSKFSLINICIFTHITGGEDGVGGSDPFLTSFLPQKNFHFIFIFIFPPHVKFYLDTGKFNLKHLNWRFPLEQVKTSLNPGGMEEGFLGEGAGICHVWPMKFQRQEQWIFCLSIFFLNPILNFGLSFQEKFSNGKK